MKNLITAAIIAITATAAHADRADLEFAQRVAEQSPAVEQCIADTLGQHTHHASRIAHSLMDQTIQATDRERFDMSVDSWAYNLTMRGDMTAAQAEIVIAEIHNCVTY